MELRVALPKDKAEVIRLWKYCFDDSAEFISWFFENRYEPENTLLAVCNNHIASALQMLPYAMKLRGINMSTSYLVGVSTWPEDRGKGYITRLLYYALQEMRRRRQWVSILLPFQYEFYRKYGWETCYSHKIYHGSVKSFASYAGATEMQGKLRPVNTADDIPLLVESYSNFTEGLNGFVQRSINDWHRLLEDIDIDKGHAYLYLQEKNVLGYIFYYIQERQFYIREMAFYDEKSKLDMLRFAASHWDLADEIRWRAPTIDNGDVMMQKYEIEWSENPFVMGRIVDAAKVLEAILKESEKSELDFTLQVIDPFLDWNNHTFRIESTSGRVAVNQTVQNPDFIVPITALAQLLWGYISPSQAINQGLVKVVSTAKIDHFSTVFHDAIPYIYEDY